VVARWDHDRDLCVPRLWLDEGLSVDIGNIFIVIRL
jgi:hypothetical protein